MPIPNQFKNIFDDLIDSLEDNTNTEVLAKSRQTHMSNNDIPGLEERIKNLNEEKNILKNWS